MSRRDSVIGRFDPVRAGFTGWDGSEDEKGMWTWMHESGIVVQTSPRITAVLVSSRLDHVYRGNVITHELVVEILLANGYEPEFEVVTVSEWSWEGEDCGYDAKLKEPITLRPRLRDGKVVAEHEPWEFFPEASPASFTIEGLAGELHDYFNLYGARIWPDSSDLDRAIADSATVTWWEDPDQAEDEEVEVAA